MALHILLPAPCDSSPTCVAVASQPHRNHDVLAVTASPAHNASIQTYCWRHAERHPPEEHRCDGGATALLSGLGGPASGRQTHVGTGPFAAMVLDLPCAVMAGAHSAVRSAPRRMHNGCLTGAAVKPGRDAGLCPAAA